MLRRRRILYATTALLVVGLVILALLEARRHRSPLSVGATADEAWTFIHSPVAWGSHGVLFETKRFGWIAHAADIQCDVKYFFHVRTNRYFFATRRVVYLVGTNSTITGVRSSWKLNRPF